MRDINFDPGTIEVVKEYASSQHSKMQNFLSQGRRVMPRETMRAIIALALRKLRNAPRLAHRSQAPFYPLLEQMSLR
jgi:hypothetical protein